MVKTVARTPASPTASRVVCRVIGILLLKTLEDGDLCSHL